MDNVYDVRQGYKIYITISVLMFFLVASTAVRAFAKLVYRGGLTLDDYFVILGTCFNVIANGMEYYALEKGLGRHSQFIPLDSLVSALKYMQLGVLMAALAIWSIKISVCFFLLALLRDTNKRFRQFLWALMFFTTVTTFIGLLLWGLQARPLERLWDPRVKGTRGSSHDYLKVVYVFYAFNAFTDLVYSLTPIWFLRKIQISKKNKYSILCLMGSGLVLTVVVCLCIYFAPAFLETEDITWALIPIIIADCTQRHLSGIVANMPAFYMLYNRTRPVPSVAKSSSSGWRVPTSKGNTGYINVTRETDIKVSTRSRNERTPDPYALDIGTDDHIPLTDRVPEAVNNLHREEGQRRRNNEREL